MRSVVRFLNEYATLILVIITAIYAYFTYKMAKIMGKQVIADIRLSNITLGSIFLEKWLQDSLKQDSLKKHQSKPNGDYRCDFKLLFDVRNRASGSGCIDKPMLILKSAGFQLSVPPITKSYSFGSTSIPNVSTQEEIDLGGTIFLRGGESQKVELEYVSYIKIETIKRIIGSVEYWIKYTDNVDKDYLVKITEVKPTKEVKRR